MPVDLPVGDHALFLWMAVATHAIIGYTLGTLLADEPAWGLLGAIFPDVDLLFPLTWEAPLVHRGLTHTPLAALVVTLLAARWNRAAGIAVGAGYASHLLLDTTTPAGIPLFFPLSSAGTGLPLGGHSGAATLLLWTGCFGALYWWHRLR